MGWGAGRRAEGGGGGTNHPLSATFDSWSSKDHRDLPDEHFLWKETRIPRENTHVFQISFHKIIAYPFQEPLQKIMQSKPHPSNV